MAAAWRRAGRPTFEVRVRPVGGEPVVCSTGTRNEDLANEMEEWAAKITDRGDVRGVVAAIASREMELKEAWRLGEDGAANLLAVRRKERAERAAVEASPDVWPVLVEWTAERLRGKKPVRSAQQSLNMIGHFFPERPLKATLWNDKEIEQRLANLKGRTWKGKERPIQDATRNRYRSVLSVASDLLRRKGILAVNPIEAVDALPETPLDFDYIELVDARRLIDGLSAENRIVAALALGFGMEWEAIEACTVRDIDTTEWTAHAHGDKRMWRDRVVPLSDIFAFLKPLLLEAVKDKLPTATLITEPHWRLLKQQKAACRALRIGTNRGRPLTIHQWRHTCAVALLQAGESVPVVAFVLGHADTALVIKRYGRFLVRGSHFLTRKRDDAVQPAAAKPATNTPANAHPRAVGGAES